MKYRCWADPRDPDRLAARLAPLDIVERSAGAGRSYTVGMRIGLVSLHTSPRETPGQGDAGGMNVVIREAALALERLGHEVSIATRASTSEPAGVTVLAPGSTVEVHALPVGDPAAGKDELPGLVGEFARKLGALPEFAAADVVHAHYWLSGLAAVDMARPRDIPVVTTLHTVGAQKNTHLAPGDSPEPESRLTGEATLARSTTLVAASSSELAGIIEGYGDPPNPSYVIPPGVDTALFRPCERPRPRTAGVHLTVLGRVQPLKGQDLAIDAFAEFVRRYPDLASGSTLTVAGEPTPGAQPYAKSLQERARAIAASAAHATIRFLPSQSRDAAARLLRSSDLVLIPSHTETFGLVALEAAASGVPVIAARTTGLVEAVREGASGVLIDGRDPGAWAEAIARLVGDRAGSQRMRETARAHALRHSWDVHARTLSARYAALVAGASR